jgi:hypothetical protein
MLPKHPVFDPIRGKPVRRLQAFVRHTIDYHRYKDRYPIQNLLVTSLPKAGSTWVERMLCEIPGFFRWLPKPEMAPFPRIPRDFEARRPRGLTVSKSHILPTDENLDVMHGFGRPYVVLMRDIRDAAVSWCFFVAGYEGHPRHPDLAPLTNEQRFDWFIENRLDLFVQFVSEWPEKRHPELGLLVTYEEMKQDTTTVFGRMLKHYGLDLGDEAVESIVRKHDFKRVTGRAPGQEDRYAFNRKAIIGDWRNHLSDRQINVFEGACGDLLDRFAPDKTKEAVAV